MRKVTYGGAMSLDGIIADPGETMDWLLWSDDARRISGDSWKGVDTILMGRKTYEFAVRGGGGENSKIRPASSPGRWPRRRRGRNLCAKIRPGSYAR
ncbi:MAG: dihydrofolate reductase family protein [Allosphingosinicella sp.]